jgi:hypothetical protein
LWAAAVLGSAFCAALCAVLRPPLCATWRPDRPLRSVGRISTCALVVRRAWRRVGALVPVKVEAPRSGVRWAVPLPLPLPPHCLASRAFLD